MSDAQTRALQTIAKQLTRIADQGDTLLKPEPDLPATKVQVFFEAVKVQEDPVEYVPGELTMQTVQPYG